jgi:hypothetical protein
MPYRSKTRTLAGTDVAMLRTGVVCVMCMGAQVFTTRSGTNLRQFAECPRVGGKNSAVVGVFEEPRTSVCRLWINPPIALSYMQRLNTTPVS